jgi:hypothetical protein
MLASLFSPVKIAALILFAAAGAAGLALLYRDYRQGCGLRPAKISPRALTVMLAVLSVLLFRIGYLLSNPELPFGYDTGLYHAQTVRWINEYGTPPGLGNLHPRLAFNSSWLAFAALLDNGPWDGRSEWLLPALAWFGALLYFLHELLFGLKTGVRLYALCVLAWLAHAVVTLNTLNLYYDDPVHMINAIVLLEAWKLLHDGSGGFSGERKKTSLLMLGAAAFMIKPIGALSLVFTGIMILFLLRRDKNSPFSTGVTIFAPAATALIIWVARNIILSGYPLYPVPVFPLPFDWTMPFESANANYRAVIGWARMPGPSYIQSLEKGFFFWFKPWLARRLHSRDFLFWTLAPAALSVFWWALVLRLARSRKALYFLVWTNLNILYWFMTAPDERFGSGFFWVNAAMPLLFLFSSDFRRGPLDLMEHPVIRGTFRYVWALAIAGFLGLAVLSPGRSAAAIGRMPSYRVRPHTVNAAVPFIVWVPANGGDDRTGNSPLPSAPAPLQAIEMRVPGKPGRGFRPVPAP